MNPTISWHHEEIMKWDAEHWPDDGFPTRKDLAPGTAFWHVDRHGSRELEYVCPCGCSHVRRLPVTRAVDKPSNCWRWDGEMEKPTVTPSIQIMRSCGWHGYLTAGVWQSC